MGVQHGWQSQTGGCSHDCRHPKAVPLTTLPAKATTEEESRQSRSRVPTPRCESNYSFLCVTTRCFTVFATCDHPSKRSIAFLQSFINDLVTGLVLGA